MMKGFLVGDLFVCVPDPFPGPQSKPPVVGLGSIAQFARDRILSFPCAAGAQDFISGNSLDARILRCKFVFKIVPMLNPDGVINGNYRCSLAGVDLNRNWMEPSRKMHPTIYNTKAMMKKFMEDREASVLPWAFDCFSMRILSPSSSRPKLTDGWQTPCFWCAAFLLPPAQSQVVLFCDLHGHSRKKDIFLYGCNKTAKVMCRV